MCLLTSTWYLLSPSPVSVYLLTCTFCRWFGYHLLAVTRSFPDQPVLQELSHMAGDLSSWILALVDTSSSEVTGLCLCYVIMQLCCFKEKLLAGNLLQRPSLPGNRSLWWRGAGTRLLLGVGIVRKQGGVTVHQIFDESTVLGLPQNLVLLHIPFEEVWGWRLLIMLASHYTACFRLKTIWCILASWRSICWEV